MARLIFVTTVVSAGEDEYIATRSKEPACSTCGAFTILGGLALAVVGGFVGLFSAPVGLVMVTTASAAFVAGVCASAC